MSTGHNYQKNSKTWRANSTVNQPGESCSIRWGSWEGLTDKVMFEKNPKGAEEAGHVDCLREQHCRQRKQHVQRPEVEEFLVLW